MKPWKIVLLSLLAILAVAAIGLVRWMRPYDLDTERKAARAAGIPLTAAEFLQVAPPANQNAVPIYLALGKALRGHDLNEQSIATSGPNGTGGIPKEKTAALKALLASRPDIGRLVHTAVAKPHAFVRHKWRFDEMFTYLAPMRTSAKWISWESILLAREGRFQEAVRHQALAFHIAQQASQDPLLISYLVGIACEVITMKGYENILIEAGPNAAVAEAVRKEIAAYHPTYDLTRCLKGEVIFGLTSLHLLRSIKDINALSQGGEEEGPEWKPSGRPASWLTRWCVLEPMEAVYLHWMTSLIKASEGPRVERNEVMAKIQAEFNKALRRRPTYIYAAIAFPAFGNAGAREVSAEARRSLVSAMASALAYRARTGIYPDSLGAAVNPAPIDPFTGKPLGYRREGAGFVVFAEPDTSGADAKAAAKLRRYNTMRYPPVRLTAEPNARPMTTPE